jgi:hypothetical protein
MGRLSITRCSLVSRLVAPTAAGRRADPVPVPRHGRQRERGIRPEPVAERRCGRDPKAVGETIRAQAIDATRKSRGRLHASWIFFSVHKLVASDRLVTAMIEFRSSTGCPQDRAGCPQTITARQQPRRVVPRVFHRYGHGFVDGFWRPCDRAGDEAPGNQGLSLCKGKAERESTIARGSRRATSKNARVASPLLARDARLGSSWAAGHGTRRAAPRTAGTLGCSVQGVRRLGQHLIYRLVATRL